MSGDVRDVRTLTGERVRVVEITHDVGGSSRALIALADELADGEFVGALSVSCTQHDESEFTLTAWVHT